MDPSDFEYSPNILIYLEVGKKRIRLADVLHNTAIRYDDEPLTLQPGTPGELIFVIDSREDRETIVLHEGIDSSSNMISFTCPNIEIKNGPYIKHLKEKKNPSLEALKANGVICTPPK